MKKLYTLLLLALTASTLSAQCGGVFFSEYIEGSSSNKATEVYNNTGSTIDLSDYVIYRFNNGSLSATDSLFPQGMLAYQDVWIFGNPSANPAIQAVADTLHTMTFYNGDDAVMIMNHVTGDTLDIIGEIGVDPGAGWPVGTGATNNSTLIRMFNITEGETDWSVGATQWDVFPIDMTDSLGMHNGMTGAAAAGFTHSTAGTTATFTNTSTGSGNSYLWDFGDGAIDTAANPVHVYAASGSYIVCLSIISGACGTDTFCDTVTICSPPTSNFSASSAGFDATFTDASSGATSYLWDFGDGNTSSASNPVHTYAANGVYTVCQTVINSCGADSTCQSVTISCTGPTADFTGTPSGMSTTFTNTSSGATSYMWDFGDGNTDTTANPTHMYTAVGTYLVCLTATNACGSNVDCDTIVITCALPTAGFNDSILNMDASFTNTSSDATSYVWDFGDGNTDTTSNPIHTYASAGSYVVCLTATNACGSDVHCDTITITCPLPVAGFTSVDTSLTVMFTDASTGASTYMWDFGDGNTSTSMSPSHSYAANGTYLVCLTVTNACGSDSTCANVAVFASSLEENLLSGTSVYPNPFNEQISVVFGSTLNEVSYSVTDINGRIVASGVEMNSTRLNLNLDVNAGIYFLNMTSGNANSTIKLMKF